MDFVKENPVAFVAIFILVCFILRELVDLCSVFNIENMTKVGKIIAVEKVKDAKVTNEEENNVENKEEKVEDVNNNKNNNESTIEGVEDKNVAMMAKVEDKIESDKNKPSLPTQSTQSTQPVEEAIDNTQENNAQENNIQKDTSLQITEEDNKKYCDNDNNMDNKQKIVSTLKSVPMVPLRTTRKNAFVKSTEFRMKNIIPNSTFIQTKPTKKPCFCDEDGPYLAGQMHTISQKAIDNYDQDNLLQMMQHIGTGNTGLIGHSLNGSLASNDDAFGIQFE